jgi:Insertion element 4 transposase N-terminal
LPDQIAITRTATVAEGVFAPGHLGELTQLAPFEAVDEVLTATRRVQQRIRLLPARVVVYLLLAGCLFAEYGYTQVWQQLTAGLAGLSLTEPHTQPPSASTSTPTSLDERTTGPTERRCA